MYVKSRIIGARSWSLTSFFASVFVLPAILILMQAGSVFGQNGRTQYMGSTNIAMPTGYTTSGVTYLSDNSHSAMLYSQLIAGKFVEFSLLRHFNGAEKDKSIMNFKLNILEEGSFIPNVVWGVSDFKESLGSKIFYFAGSKTFDSFGVKLHGGFYKDPITTDRKEFYGVEKTIFPLIALIAERVEGKHAIGLKMSPYPGATFEYSRRLKGADDQQSIYKLSYSRTF